MSKDIYELITARFIERLAAPDSASIQIRTMLSPRSHKSTTARNLIDPILDVRIDWRWQKLKITIDLTSRMNAAYGRQHQSHTFRKRSLQTGVSLDARIPEKMKNAGHRLGAHAGVRD